MTRAFLLLIGFLGLCGAGFAEGPYFVTYSHQMEERGNLEIENKSAIGKPSANDRFWGSSVEFEYGVTGWWTTELYLDQQVTANQGGLFAGMRWENRFHLTKREHWINPVLYAEIEDISGADKSLLEVVGHDTADDLAVPNAESRREHAHEAELKLLLGSNFRNWNISENLIFEKNLGHAPWEFGYAVALSRPLGIAASSRECAWCRENFSAGVELYGGLGDWNSFSLHNTSHYVAPTVSWALPNGLLLKASPGFGVTDGSLPYLFRVGVTYEIPQIARHFRRQAQ
jgi:hypothetical protein